MRRAPRRSPAAAAPRVRAPPVAPTVQVILCTKHSTLKATNPQTEKIALN